MDPNDEGRDTGRGVGDITDATGRADAHLRTMELILAGDIGGTKTRLGLFEPSSPRPVATETFRTAGYEHPAEPVGAFLAATRARPAHVCLGIAAPVQGGVASSVKLPWTVDAEELRLRLGLPAVRLVNDVEANARGIAALEERDLATMHAGAPGAAGTRAVVSAGTGLGEAAIWWDGAEHRPGPSEGGSCSFAPRSELEIELLRFLAAETGRVSVGQVCSGPGLQNLYRFFSGEHEAPEPAQIAARAAADRRSAASAAVDLLVSIYGARAGDVALSYGATGGVYLGGGIAPKLLPRLLEGGFMQAFLDKGSLRRMLERIPVHVVLNSDAALIGAALFARDELGPALRAAA